MQYYDDLCINTLILQTVLLTTQASANRNFNFVGGKNFLLLIAQASICINTLFNIFLLTTQASAYQNFDFWRWKESSVKQFANYTGICFCVERFF